MKKIYRIEGIIIKRKLIREKAKKEGLPTFRKVIMQFRKELVATSEKEALEKIYSIYGGIHKVKRSQIKILKVQEIGIDEVEDLALRKFLTAVQNGEI